MISVKTLFSKFVIEITTQILIVLSFVFLLIPSTATLSDTRMFSSSEVYTAEVEGGLGNIKVLLYENLSLFLLLSTFVLLIALLGAAVMTRNKR